MFLLLLLQAFRTAEKLKCHIKDCFKINSKQTFKMPKRGECECVKSNILSKKMETFFFEFFFSFFICT